MSRGDRFCIDSCDESQAELIDVVGLSTSLGGLLNWDMSQGQSDQ